MSRVCPVPRCREAVTGQICCRRHWFQLPASLRTRLWRMSMHERGSEGHRLAIAEAHKLLGAMAEPRKAGVA